MLVKSNYKPSQGGYFFYRKTKLEWIAFGSTQECIETSQYDHFVIKYPIGKVNSSFEKNDRFEN